MTLALRIAFVWLLVCMPSWAFAQVDPAEQGKKASTVIVARVVKVEASFETNRFGDQVIVTDAELDVEETLKGESGRRAHVKVEGGTVGDLTLEVSDMPTLAPGERAVFFLEQDDDGVDVPSERGRGVLKLNVQNRVIGTDLTLDDVRRGVRGQSR